MKLDTLARLLTRRFGTLPEWVAERLSEGTLEQLDALFDRGLDAATLAEVFGGHFGPLPSWCLHALRRADAAELRQLRSCVSFFDGNRCDKWHRQCDTASI